MNIFLSTALTHVPRSLFDVYANFQHQIAHVLENEINGSRVMYALIDSDPQLARNETHRRATLCYQWDRSMVEDADLVLAEASFPSTGQGIELQVAESLNIPIIMFYSDFGLNKSSPVTYLNPDRSKNDLQIGAGFVSLMALGLPNIKYIFQYEGISDGLQKISKAVRSIKTTRNKEDLLCVPSDISRYIYKSSQDR